MIILLVIGIYGWIVNSKTVVCTVKSSINNQPIIYGNDSTIYVEPNCPHKGGDMDLSSLNGDSTFYLTGEYNTITTPSHQFTVQRLILTDIQINNLIIGRVNITISEESQIHKIDNIHSTINLCQTLWISSLSKKAFQISVLQSFSQHFKVIIRNIDLTITKLLIENDATIVLLNKANVLITDPTFLSDIFLEFHSGSTMQFWLDVHLNNTIISFEEEKSLRTSSTLYLSGLTSILFNIPLIPKCNSKYELFGGQVIYNKDITKVKINEEDVSYQIQDDIIVHYPCPIPDLYIYLIIACCGLVIFILGLILIAIIMKFAIIPQLQRKLKNAHDIMETSSLLQKHSSN
ncbi:hypothetical protein EHI8A_109860 [Entamoeba histolytica HM-1:IMSS-B]|uniref:Uncharacterized protein n=6 Tax=Entamoeba histolytica TaxID=5759 RepID=C4M523_ENTH1|nr:hypothetical protein EHI_128080 [Entamoeba histolytica HM-1:IMSS]EMD46222.1 Hypothetical protein EHI5A_109070 [Entamoeba histolytica KU27]EMH73541.1 hypothetical protein EHI8A_109860 [Entamoeba histolytica HM-1:IMSS-B]EMS15741.1 hypothetical protein KM1_180440 [Entamoeba histolytica HM-3:IMSS]ENY62490.1 hypothetical protein EHI7A_102590 [Entamoeba histolytica HM-1:IMSS-A]GAT96499.1 hypothetical protein CL6EHI_128080 [Entamoeba histolytica]|eukprot:XP_648281.1 hypothetical protein EHI_128080 [Entamoeba histolytica HM-1:IMSS]